ncbi:MAG: DUF4209 domain-containing protein [Nevskia sp.]|jgi:tetratricopeptide (TPR) repeat protein|nr:DUF4209 domain-containing protein [Nevskia sp.]
MTTETTRYPADFIVTEQDFKDCGYLEALSDASDGSYVSLWQALSDAARKAINEQRTARGKVLWLLADACSMMLQPASTQEPFKPYMVIDGRRSAIPEDFGGADILFLSTIAERVPNSRIRARLADLIWLTHRKLGVSYALMAVNAYRSLPLNKETWLLDSRDCWHRAVRLALTLGNGALEQLKDMEAAILVAFESAATEDGFYPLWLASLLFDHQLGLDKAVDIGVKLRQIAILANGAGNYHRARSYFDAAAQWFKRLKDADGFAEMTIAFAESWVKEAVAHTAANSPSFMIAAGFYEKAIQIYRSVPRRQRAVYRVDERIAELHKSMSEAGKRSLDEMGPISAPGVDVRELVEAAQAAVRGKPIWEALASFVNLDAGANVVVLRTACEKAMREHPLQMLFAATYISNDGRVVARRPAASFGDTEAQDSEPSPTLWAQMIRHYQERIDLVVQTKILPALEVLRLEHRLREDNFIQLAQQSPAVPVSRERLWGRALFAGYDHDFDVTLYLLIPQVEHLVRSHLKAAGAKTTILDKDGVENEYGLSTLVDFPQAINIFGENLNFELKALFCDAIGPNLRNEVAHGLLDDGMSHTPWSIYAWWLMLRIVFNGYRNARST